MNNIARSMLLLLVFFGLLACASVHKESRVSRADLQPLLSGEGILPDAMLGQPMSVLLPAEDPFEISDEMVTFVRHFVPEGASTRYRTRWLLEALVGKAGLGLQYQPLSTQSARDTFVSGQANCLSFTILYAALAEELGLNIAFNDVSVPPVWDMLNDETFINYKHVNIIVEQSMGRDAVIDINMSEYAAYYPQQQISKDRLLALYYANVGVEQMYAGDITAAYLNLRKSIEIDAELGLAWVNLGVLYRRQGFEDSAVIAYRHALSVDPKEITAAGNLARLLRSRGDAEAAVYERLVAAYRQKNPYYHFTKAKWLFQQQDLLGAEQSLDAALALAEDHRFYFLKAQLSARKGEVDKTVEYLKLAGGKAADPSLEFRYSQKAAKIKALASAAL